jgi:molecular chaperone GrpE
VSDAKENQGNTSPFDAVDASVADVSQEADPVIASLRNELAEANERLLRTQAEFENFRRRTRREIEDNAKFASQPLLRDLLPVVDNIDRALESSQLGGDGSGLLEGVKMVSQQLVSVLEKHNCPRIGSPGDPFDPELHEAIGHQPSTEFPAGTVSAVARPGYKLYDRVIRPTQVIVSSGEQT